MPQANITYDTEYNRRLVSKVRKNEARTTMANQPTEIPMRNGSYHDPHERVVMEGGSTLREFVLSGNSPAYPPINMRSGMEVSSGGRYAGVDGAVGGNFLRDFAKGFTDVIDFAAKPLSFLMPPVGVGLSGLSGIVKGLAGRGRARKHKRKMKSCPMCAEMGCPCGGAKSGGVMVGNKKDACGRASGTRDFGKPCGGEMLASPAAEVGKKMKKARAKKADMSRVMDAVEATKPMLGGAKSGGAKSGGAKSGGAKSGGAKSGGAKKGGRNARAEIVKKVMKERGVKMIEASKIVKKEGLY